MKRVKLVGRRIGRIVVEARLGARKAVVVCDCGTRKTVFVSNLYGNTKSCGCLLTDAPSARVHGMSRTPEHIAWANMRQRCRDPRVPAWRNYGGRGITVCERWLESFENFYADMGPRPSPKHTIDRINNDGNYEPGNCRWATRKVQAQNRRRPRPRTPIHVHE